MNIFEELAENYTYNGIVSLKAIDDDIVTLENQIDSLNATLREIQLRGKKPGRLTERIRDAKIRLSLLKALFKRESDKTSPDDAILGVLGVSANHAKEVEIPETAADKKAPLPQNFEKVEIETTNDEKSTCAVEEGMLNSGGIAVENIKSSDDEVKNNVVAETETPRKDGSISEFENVEKEREETIESKPEIAFVNEHDIVATDKTPDSINAFPAPKRDIDNEKDKDVVTNEELSTTESTHYLAEAPDEALNDIPITAKTNDSVQVEKDESTVKEGQEETDDVCPPPTIDDYEESIDNVQSETFFDEDDRTLDFVTVSSNNSNVEYIVPEKDEINEEQDTEVNYCVSDTIKEYPSFDAFPEEAPKIYCSFDLYEYTNQVNTNTITGYFDAKRKVLELTFTDMRDYPLFSFFLKEKTKKRSLFDCFRKKQKSIIMYVRIEEPGGIEKAYHYEFTDCHSIEVIDSDYGSMRDAEYYGGTSIHEFHVIFKYKNLKIS